MKTYCKRKDVSDVTFVKESISEFLLDRLDKSNVAKLFAYYNGISNTKSRKRIRDNTWGTKNNIARTKILPYFGERKIAEIEPKDVIAWQNHLLAFKRANGKGYSASYLRKIHSQLSAIFNHAVDFYHLPSNPAQKAGNIAIEEYKEMLF